jgi:hypothetical protein
MLLSSCLRLYHRKTKTVLRIGVVIHGHKTFSSPTLNRNSFKSDRFYVLIVRASPYRSARCEYCFEVPPKREIALETLIPPPPASKRGSSHLIFCSATRPLKWVYQEQDLLSV